MVKTLLVLLALTSIAVPGRALDSQGSQGWVVLPAEEYRTLVKRAYPAEPKPEPPPVAATLTQVDYDLRVSGDTATGTARLTVDVLKDGWAEVGVPQGLRVRDVKIDGRPGSILGQNAGASGGVPRLLLSRPGRSQAVLEVAVPVASSAGSESMTLPASEAAVTTVSLVLPRRGVEVSVWGGLLAERSEGSNESRFTIYGRPTVSLTIAWKRRLDDRAAQPLRFRGTVTEFVGLGEDGSQINAEVGVEVLQGVATTLTMALGDSLVVNQVSGASVSDWDYKPGTLTVSFLEPVDAQAKLVVTAEAHTPRDGVVTVPLLRLSEAERETGGVAVDVLGAGEIKDRQTRGLDAADPSDLGEIVSSRGSPSLTAFRFRPQEGSVPRSLSVAVARYTPEAVIVANVDEARYEALVTEEGKALVRARFAVRNNQRSFLAMRLPERAALWSAAVSGRPIRPGRAEDGALLLPLEKGRSREESPSFPVEVVYMQTNPAWEKNGRFHLTLPAVDLQVSRTGLVLYHSPRFTVTPEFGAFREEPYAEPASDAIARAEAPPGYAYGRVQSVIEEAQQNMPAAKEPAVQELVNQYQREASGRRVTGALPIRMPFPTIGTLVYFVSELSAENSAPSLDLKYKQSTTGVWQ